MRGATTWDFRLRAMPGVQVPLPGTKLHLIGVGKVHNYNFIVSRRRRAPFPCPHHHLDGG